MVTPETTRAARPILAGLEMLSAGTTTNLQPATARNADTALYPPGDRHPPHLHHAHAITAAAW